MPRLLATASIDVHDDADDRRLMRRICVRELAAFELLYRRYRVRLQRFAGRMLRPEHLADEVVNDTLHVVWKDAERFNGTSKVSTWIFGIAYRKALHAIDRHDDPMEDGRDDDELAMDVADQPDSRFSQVETRAAIALALRGLSADQRAAVELTYYHGFSYPEIALIVDCPVDTVKTRMFHARRRLRDAFDGTLDHWL